MNVALRKLELLAEAYRIDAKLTRIASRSRGRWRHPRPALRAKKPGHAVVAAFYMAQAQVRREALRKWPDKP